MRTILIVTVTLTGVLLLSCQPKTSDADMNTESAGHTLAAQIQPAEEDAPLLLEDEPLLLADEPLLLLDDAVDTVEGADNSRCHVCHINYTQDPLAVLHAKANMGCATCHGESDEHIADESWASGGNGTAPGKMYPRDTINPFCLGCHPPETMPAKEHQVVLAAHTDKVCTDCHGTHRLHERRCQWK